MVQIFWSNTLFLEKNLRPLRTESNPKKHKCGYERTRTSRHIIFRRTRTQHGKNTFIKRYIFNKYHSLLSRRNFKVNGFMQLYA